MKQVQSKHKLSYLKPDPKNPRIDESFADLLPSVLVDGLKTPIMIIGEKCATERPKGGILRGHRRYNCLRYIHDNPKESYQPTGPKGPEGEPINFGEAWKKHFSDGVPCVEVENATAEELADLHVDQADMRPLSDKLEVQLAANLLFDAGFTEARVAHKLAPLMDLLWPLSAKRKGEMTKLREEKGDSAFYREYSQYRRGLVQQFKRVWSLPEEVIDVLRFQATGKLIGSIAKEKPDNLPKLNDGRIQKLVKALDADIESGGNYGKHNPGPNFHKEWAGFVKADREASAEPSKEARRPMKATDLDNQAKKILTSAGMKALTLQHKGEDVDDKTIKEADNALFLVELVRDHVKEAKEVFGNGKHFAETAKKHGVWRAFTEVAHEVEAIVKKAAKEAAAKALEAEEVEAEAVA